MLASVQVENSGQLLGADQPITKWLTADNCLKTLNPKGVRRPKEALTKSINGPILLLPELLLTMSSIFKQFHTSL